MAIALLLCLPHLIPAPPANETAVGGSRGSALTHQRERHRQWSFDHVKKGKALQIFRNALANPEKTLSEHGLEEYMTGLHGFTYSVEITMKLELKVGDHALQEGTCFGLYAHHAPGSGSGPPVNHREGGVYEVAAKDTEMKFVIQLEDVNEQSLEKLHLFEGGVLYFMRRFMHRHEDCAPKKMTEEVVEASGFKQVPMPTLNSNGDECVGMEFKPEGSGPEKKGHFTLSFRFDKPQKLKLE